MLTHFYFLPLKSETLTAPFNGYGKEDVYMAYTGAHYMLLSAVNGLKSQLCRQELTFCFR